MQRRPSWLSMNRGVSILVNYFPLTPAPSPGERAKQGTAGETRESVGFVGRQQRFMVPMRVEKNVEALHEPLTRGFTLRIPGGGPRQTRGFRGGHSAFAPV